LILPCFQDSSTRALWKFYLILFSHNLELSHFILQKLLELSLKLPSQKFANLTNFSQNTLKICIVCVMNWALSILLLKLKSKPFTSHLIYTSTEWYQVQQHSKSLSLLLPFLFSLTVSILNKLECCLLVPVNFSLECILNSAHFQTCFMTW